MSKTFGSRRDAACRVSLAVSRETGQAPSLHEQFARCLQDGVGSEAELLLQILERRGRSKGVHADDASFRSRILRPAEGRSLLDCDSCGDVGRKHLIAVTLVLMFEQVPRRHADDARPDAFGFQFLVGVDAEVHLAACLLYTSPS